MSSDELIQQLRNNSWLSSAKQAADEIERLRKENANNNKLRIDAERYRWLREHIMFHNVNPCYPTEGPNIPVLSVVSRRLWYHATLDITHDTLDDVIDSSMRK